MLKRIARALLPPILIGAWTALRRRSTPSTYAYLPGGWPEQSRSSGEPGGWNAASVVRHYKDAWPAFVASQSGTQPLYLGAAGLFDHNAVAVFNYALARAAHGHERLTMLDYGGGVGHYLLRSRAAMPDLAIDYHCKDVPALVEAGRALLPQAVFYDDDACFDRAYDFVLVSSSLQYCRDWRADLGRLAASVAPGGYLLVTRAPTHDGPPTYAFSQTAYGTTYAGWSINTAELLDAAAGAGLRLEREFHLADVPEPIPDVPAPCYLRGYLLRRPAA